MLQYTGVRPTYEYDEKGRLIKLSNWENKESTFTYDGMNRHETTTAYVDDEATGNVVQTATYAYNVNGWLTDLHHHDGAGTPTTLAQFQYTAFDGLGNRTQAVEMVNSTAKTIDYAYDDLSRVQSADYTDGSREYAYNYDVAGNRLQEQVTIDNTGTPVTTTTNWTYNAANQIATMQVGSNPVSNFSYDSNGNLTTDGQFSYTWDHNDRLNNLNTGSVNYGYGYDGAGNRIKQSVGSTATDYLLDLQPSLALVLSESTSSTTERYIHAPMGVHSIEDNAGDWHWFAQDGLGSIRTQVDMLSQIEATMHHSPYGQPFDATGTFAGSFGYAGEQIDGHGLSYNRARYYSPSIGAFASIDPFEGVAYEPMSLNGYGYVEGNPISISNIRAYLNEAIP